MFAFFFPFLKKRGDQKTGPYAERYPKPNLEPLPLAALFLLLPKRAAGELFVVTSVAMLTALANRGAAL